MTKVWLPVVDVYSMFPRIDLQEFNKQYIVRARPFSYAFLQGMILTVAEWDEDKLKYIHYDWTVVGEIYDLQNALEKDHSYYLDRSPHKIRNQFGYKRDRKI